MTRLFIPGSPKPQGSKRHIGGGRMVEASKQLPQWRRTVAAHATAAFSTPTPNAVTVDLEFVMPRPKALRARPAPPMIQRPDVDKLARAVLDGLTGTAFHDDSQVTVLHATKRRAGPDETPGVWVTVA